VNIENIKELIVSPCNKTINEHKVMIVGMKRYFYYQFICICEVNDRENKYIINKIKHNTTVINKISNEYKKQLSKIGYKYDEYFNE